MTPVYERPVYGPVRSWRLGKSLGVDIIGCREKLCPFDCVYCQLGDTIRAVSRRREFVPLSALDVALTAAAGIAVDHATFSGMGEPTLAANLGDAIECARARLGAPVAVLTNSALMYRDDVRADLARADTVVAKLDAADEATFRRVDRPRVRCSLSQIADSIRRFRDAYQGRLAIQMMFVESNRHQAADLARLVAALSPDEVQINTPLRPCAVAPLSPVEMESIRGEFADVDNVISVYEAPARRGSAAGSPDGLGREVTASDGQR